MRKIKVLLFTFLVCFLLINNVKAAKMLECKYDKGHDTYRVIYNLNGDTSSVYKIYKTNDYVTDEDVTDTYISWFNVNLKENDSCPSTAGNEGQLTLFTPDNATQGGVVTDNGPSSCSNYKTEISCGNSGETGKVACLWNVKELDGQTYKYCNVDNLLYVSCGDARDIPIQVPSLISFFVNLLKIATPIILIFMGIITLVKAIAASKEDEIKKAQGSLVKKLIAAAMVFFVITIVQFVISLVADAEYASDNGLTEKENLSACLECFLDNDCEKTAYYKTNIAGSDHCTYLIDGVGEDGLCPGEELR